MKVFGKAFKAFKQVFDKAFEAFKQVFEAFLKFLVKFLLLTFKSCVETFLSLLNDMLDERKREFIYKKSF